MRLSRLHISGFKSFPDRSELGFDQGVTAIVGPNGCGKSNVVDAITWVLGEQSAKSLRGERMEDVIFAGSDMRKPTATAEVRLAFKQVPQVAGAIESAAGEVDELLDRGPVLTRDVEIGRRLYRSGESEYLIDGEVCRLKDIHELLMDSGLGVKAYAVIEQGKIGQILSSRPAERRMLIEEAAGVTKYKSRRRAAELKLEAARSNLTRIDDVIFEIDKQRGALKRQAARARRYKRLREELRTWEQVQFARRHAVLREEIAATEARLADAQAREAAAAARVAEVETALETARVAFTEAEREATTTRERAHAMELEIGRLQQQAAFDRQQVEELTRQAESFAADLAELEARQEPATRAIEAQRDAAVRARESLEAAARRTGERDAAYAQAMADVQAAEAHAESGRAALLAASTALSALLQARDHAAAARDRAASDRERLDIEARELQAELERASQAHGDAERALADARAALERSIAERQAAEAALADLGGRRTELVQALGARERDLAGREARLRSLEQLEARRARFGDAARRLLAEGGDAVRHLGAVADQIEVERTGSRAVDALLGDLLQYVLVERAADVQTALAWLSAHEAGRCGFVVLDEAPRTGDSAPAPADLPAGTRRLSDVARAVGPHADVIARLLPSALIAESFDEARDLARRVEVPVASLAGDVFRGGWLIQAGSHQGAHGILETRAETVALRDEVETAAAEVQTLAADLAGLDAAIEDGQRRLAESVARQHAQEKAIVGYEAGTSRAADDRERITRRLDVVRTERARAEEEVSATERRREEALVAIAEREAEQQRAQAALGESLGAVQRAREAADAAMRLLAETRTEQATLTERVAGLDLEVSRLEEAARDLAARIDARRDEIARTHARREQLGVSIENTLRALDEAVVARDAMKDGLRALDERAAELREAVTAREQDIRGARHAHDAVRSDVTQFEVARATAAADLSHLEASCIDAVGVGLAEVSETVARLEAEGALVPPATRTAGPAEDEEEDEDAGAPAAASQEAAEAESGDAASSSEALAAGPAEPGAADAAAAQPAGPIDPDPIVAALRRKIERLGPVNMMAIEQFDELETRHTFLTNQRADLIDSIAQTGQAIQRIEKTTRERFEAAFASINSHFESTFTTLFGGGRAGLVLIDQENDQESGIDIIAQPPGKRLQNVQLLSGGEKALTAMALMFAIFKHRPSPFCLLDEIDAPLDDANIGRFVEMLQGMQEHTQFILITHNRKTMEIADRLYGVTMEEPGVSKLISIQLN